MAHSAMSTDWLAAVPQRVGTCVDRIGEQIAVKSVLAVVAVHLWIGRAAAQSDGGPAYCGDADVPAAVAAVIDLLNSLQLWGVGIGLAAAAIAYVYGGLLLVFGGGDPQRVERAKTAVVYATIGIVIVLLSGALVGMVETKICQSLS